MVYFPYFMKRTICILLAAVFAGWNSYGDTGMTNAAQVARAQTERVPGGELELRAQVAACITGVWSGITLKDSSGFIRAYSETETAHRLVPGDWIHAKGTLYLVSDSVVPFLTSLEIVSHGPAPKPIEATPTDVYSGRLNHAIVRMQGTVLDVFRDETDSRFSFLVLSVGGQPISIPSANVPYERLARFVGAEIAVTGPCSAYNGQGPRAKLEYEVYIDDESDVTVLTPPPSDPFEAPVFEGNVRSIIFPAPGDAMRRRLVGNVEAMTANGSVYLRVADGSVSRVRLQPDGPKPEIDATIEAVGIAETDFYSLNLSRAVWRTAEASPTLPDRPPLTHSIPEIFRGPDGAARFDARLNGQILRTRGTICDLQKTEEGCGMIYLRDGDVSLDVDATSVPRALDGLGIGCLVEVTGLCVAQTENWRPQSPFPHIEAMRLVLRRPADVTIVARPSWWTHERLRIAVLLLLSVLLVFSAYSLILTRLIRHRTEELHRQRQTAEHAEIRRFERTRLAIELHDSIVQMLTGSAMEVETALEIGKADHDAMAAHLRVADKTLQSCRDELRNSIWDLRNDALEEEMLEGAIRRTLTPHVNKAQIEIRFPVRRDLLSDNTCHAVIKVIRELTLNALRHGHAQSVRISGAAENGELRFSVADDGCGFDPANRPGILEGHFGLQGVKERIHALGGTFAISSQPGQGTEATVAMPLDPEMK